jgi:peptide/nickel transport system substrate-binding protein
VIRKNIIFFIIGVFVLASCRAGNLKTTESANPSTLQPTGTTLSPLQTPSVTPVTVQTQLPAPTSTPIPKHLSICVGREPKSLFFYAANTASGRNILAAIYDGPFERLNFNNLPVIMESVPSLTTGDAELQPVDVHPGEWMVDAQGNRNVLAEGVLYRPSGCREYACAERYAGDQAVKMDQWVMRFRLREGVRWSDGQPVTVDDSLFSYEVSQALRPPEWLDLLNRTASYDVQDESTVTWTGIPGYQDADATAKFFVPLPRHVWGVYPIMDLSSLEAASRVPLGWGPYRIVDWTAGDHITLEKNPYYFRAAEGLPTIDHLVFRFVDGSEDALAALLAGECDLADQDSLAQVTYDEIKKIEGSGQLQVFVSPYTAWEAAFFGIDSLDEQRVTLFASQELRQAVGLCINRMAVAAAVAGVRVAESFVPQENPLYADPGLEAYDPQAAVSLLESLGWVDADQDVSTPLEAVAVLGITPGTPLSFEYRVADDADRLAVAEIIKESLRQCGIQMQIVSQAFSEYLAPGSEGPVFGRRFDMAQFAWSMPNQPPCYLFLSDQIPGPFPDYARGWGGANAGGYSSAAFDQACYTALTTLAEEPLHQSAYAQVQEIFNEDLPAIPLYWHFRVLLARPDLCIASEYKAQEELLQNIEEIDYGESCR